MPEKLPRVLHVIDSLAAGGAERMLIDIVNNIHKDKYQVSVCVTRSNKTLSRELQSDIPFMTLGRKWRFDPMGFIHFKQFSDKQQVDIFHVHGRTSYSFLLMTRLLGLGKSPIVLHDHYGVHLDNSVPVWFKVNGAKELAHYIGVCEELAGWAAKAGVPLEKISVVGNGLDMDRFKNVKPLNLHSLLDIPDDKPIGIVVGTIRAEKGLDLLIEASLHFKEKAMPYFVIVGKEIGDEFNRICKNKILDSGLQAYFRFVGVQDNALAWIKGADFAVMPARSESGPLVLIEYLMCGLPFAAFNVGWVSNLLQKYIPECFAEPGDTSQLYHLINDLLNEPKEKIIARTAKGRKLAGNLFDIKDRIPTFEGIYQKVLS